MAEIEILERLLISFGEKTPGLIILFFILKYVWPDLRDIILKWLDVKGLHDDDPDPVTSRLDKLVESISELTVEVRGMARENVMLGRLAAAGELRTPGVPAVPLTRPPVSPSAQGESREPNAAAESIKG